jgi:hypothetical protein
MSNFSFSAQNVNVNHKLVRPAILGQNILFLFGGVSFVRSLSTTHNLDGGMSILLYECLGLNYTDARIHFLFQTPHMHHL